LLVVLIVPVRARPSFGFFKDKKALRRRTQEPGSEAAFVAWPDDRPCCSRRQKQREL
jgi:hypothetical protein